MADQLRGSSRVREDPPRGGALEALDIHCEIPWHQPE
jgi:hypothetical protein